jgi:GNAT superfamily N-acetyltransferase
VTFPSLQQGEFEISTDPGRLDLDAVHAYLTRSYWAAGVPMDVVRRSIERSIVFGVYRGTQQVGFARVISDEATFAWLCDVFVLEEFQGQGLGKWLMECIVADPRLQGLRRFMLATRDAHGLYAQYGFTPVPDDRYMERRNPDPYR